MDNALENKANLLLGGKILPDSMIYEPTLLTDVRGDMKLANEEIFGPIIAIQRLAY